MNKNEHILSINRFDKKKSTYLYHQAILSDSFTLIIIDTIIISLALIIGNSFLYHINNIPFSITNGWLIIPVWIVFSIFSGILPCWGVGIVDELKKIQKTLFFMFAFILIISFLSKIELSSSRIVFLITYFISSFFIPIGRLYIKKYRSSLGSWGVPVSIYGNQEDSQEFIELLNEDLSLGYKPSSIFLDDKEKDFINNVPVEGNLENIDNKSPVAIILQGSISNKKYLQIIDGPASCYHRVVIIPEIISLGSLWVSPIDFQGTLGLEVTKNLLDPASKLMKIFLDYFFIIFLIPIWMPLVLILYLLIWLEDFNNPLFLQERVGINGKTFKTIKFRTMVPNAELVLEQALASNKFLNDEWKQSYKLKKDPRITKIGRFLRVSSLDEIPQLFNVLFGNMSIVGPRPLPIYHYNDLPKYVQNLRVQVKPGITGMWQVSGRSESGTYGMKKWDPYYVRNWSVWLDIVIIFRTVKAVFSKKGAY